MSPGYLAPEAQAKIDQAKAKRDARIHGGQPVFDSRLGARTIGDMALIKEGCVVWARQEAAGGDLTDVRLAHDGEARGGIVLQVVDQLDDIDEETGALETTRGFRTWNWLLGQPDDPRTWTTLTEAQVDLAACEPPSMSLLRTAVLRFAMVAVKQLQRKGPLTRPTTDLLTDAAHLAAIVTLQRG